MPDSERTSILCFRHSVFLLAGRLLLHPQPHARGALRITRGQQRLLRSDAGKGKHRGPHSAGHNGIESIDKFIRKDYSRVRIGIGRPKTKADVSDHVLKDFDEDEMLQLEKITNNIINSISILLDKKLDLFSSTVNNK